MKPALLALALLAANAAQAAGGHHGVDDAAMLARGECEQESWLSAGRGQRVQHAGVACRVGGLELGAAAEHTRGEGSDTDWSLEAKWAREIVDGLSLGIDLQPVWEAHHRPRYGATIVTGLLTWTPRPGLALHLNLGRDLVRGAADLPRGGVALEWSPVRRWSLLAERYLEDGTHYVRAGVRWQAGRSWTLDASHTHRISGPQPSLWTLGITFDLDDD